MPALQKNKTAAHIVPLALFLGLQFLVPAIRIENPDLPWWRSSPEHWIYPLQAVLCLALLIFWRRQYHFGKPRLIGFAMVFGLIGIAIWLVPSWLGWQDRSGETGGFDPTVFNQQTHPVVSWSVLAMRFLRLVVVVPFVEEIFWRGFLMRWLIESKKRWDEIPIGTFGHLSFWGTTVMVGLAHAGPDFLVALIWGALIGFVTLRAKNLWAPVVAHAVANLALGIYIMKTGSWGLW